MLNAEANKALKAPAVRDKLGDARLRQFVGGTPQEADAYVPLRDDEAGRRWSQKSGLKAQ